MTAAENDPRPDGGLLSVAEAMGRLHVGRTKLYELIAAGELRSVKLGATRRFRPADVQATIDWYAEHDGRPMRPKRTRGAAARRVS